jgi:adenylate cyclase
MPARLENALLLDVDAKLIDEPKRGGLRWRLWALAPLLHVFAVSMTANFSVSFASVFLLNPLIRTPELREFQNVVLAGTWPKVALLAIPLAVWTVLALRLAWPLARMRFHPEDPDVLAAARRTALKAPLYQALLCFPGWGLGQAVFQSTAWIKGIPPETRWEFVLILRNQMSALVCACIVYYWLEYLLRRFYMPTLFPDGGLSQQQWASRLSVRFRFYIFYFAICVFPAVTLYSIILAQMAPEQRAPFEGLLDWTLVGALTVAAWLTYIVSTGYQRPLVEMKEALGRVRTGDYDVRVKVTSDDELGALGDGFNEMTAGLKERELIRATFGRMVDPNVRDHLLRGNLQLGGEVRQAAVLFVDIRGFTSLSETMRPDDVVRLLNFYFDRLGRVIVGEQGMINKYIGDAMMAVFGAPVPLPNPAAAALRAAVRMRDAVDGLNQELVREGLPPLQTGIGIHCGPVLAGNIGSAERMEYTVIGDTVNLASRVEALCKELSCDLLLTQGVMDRVDDEAEALNGHIEFVATHSVRGRQEPVRLYTVRAGA